MKKLHLLFAAVALALTLGGVAATPAQAHDGWHGDRGRFEHRGGGGEWREHEWREHHRYYGPRYYYPGGAYYYPGAYYAPPAPVYTAPSVTFVVPFR